MQLLVVFTVVQKLSRCKAKFSKSMMSSVGNGSYTVGRLLDSSLSTL